MKTSDVLISAQKYGSRFVNWMGFELEWECVYDKFGNIVCENDPKDSGGLTFAGIDKRSHPDFNFKNPNPEEVVDIYHDFYWVPSHAVDLGFPVGEVVANFAVNMGMSPAIKMLQTAVNILPGRGSTIVDGLIGPKTISAAETENKHNLADLIEDEADERYRRIVQINPKNRGFLQGWLNRDDELEKWWMNLLKN